MNALEGEGNQRQEDSHSSSGSGMVVGSVDGKNGQRRQLPIVPKEFGCPLALILCIGVEEGLAQS